MAATAEMSRRRRPSAASEPLLEAQRRYFEAWRDAGQIMMDAMRTVMRRQAELTEEGIHEFWAEREAMLRAGGQGEYRPGEQIERLQARFQKAFGNYQELTEIVINAQSEAMRVLTDGTLTAVEDSTRKAA